MVSLAERLRPVVERSDTAGPPTILTGWQDAIDPAPSAEDWWHVLLEATKVGVVADDMLIAVALPQRHARRATQYVHMFRCLVFDVGDYSPQGHPAPWGCGVRACGVTGAKRARPYVTTSSRRGAGTAPLHRHQNCPTRGEPHSRRMTGRSSQLLRLQMRTCTLGQSTSSSNR